MTTQEIWEQIKKMSREEQLDLADQICALDPEGLEHSERESEMLATRDQEAKRRGFPGRPADDVLADLEGD